MIHYSDTAEDCNIRIDFNRYMTEIFNLSNIPFKNGLVETTTDSNQGIAIPLSYGNATLNGSNNIGNVRYTGFVWFAWDNYSVDKSVYLEANKDRDIVTSQDKSDPTFFSWGMGSIRFTIDSWNASIAIGGARQFYGTGKQFQSDLT